MHSEPTVTIEIARELGLTDEEYRMVVDYLGGRTPTYTELGMYSVMWSEHCSYKNSIAVLKTLPRERRTSARRGGRGECRAGGHRRRTRHRVQDREPQPPERHRTLPGRGDRRRRHPSRHLHHGRAAHRRAQQLRFGDPGNPRVRTWSTASCTASATLRQLLRRADGRRGGLFRCLLRGQPAGQRHGVGIVKHGETATATAAGGRQPGHDRRLLDRTRRHPRRDVRIGTLGARAESKRPSVQVGDPFTEKLLLEATLEIIAKI
jgi:phosphoribosylformylglycinamidine synthase subunit PurL